MLSYLSSVPCDLFEELIELPGLYKVLLEGDTMKVKIDYDLCMGDPKLSQGVS